MTTDSCSLLIVEDDPKTAELLVEFVRSLGMSSRVAASLEEVDVAIAEGGFCGVVLDKQLPASVGAIPLVATGDTALRRLRAVDARRNEDDHHVLPILIVTGASTSDVFINANYRLGATSFIPKPLDPERITKEILDGLARAGRASHAACAALRPARAAAEELAPPVSPDALRVVLDGLRIERRTSFLINDRRCDLPDSLFAPFLRMAAPRARGSDVYRSAADLGTLRNPHIPARIQRALEHVLPEGFSILQRGEGSMFRLHALVSVAPIDWAIFERHRDPRIQGIATAERKLR